MTTTPNVSLSVVDCQRDCWASGWVEWENRKLANVVQCNAIFFFICLDKEIKFLPGEGKDFSIFFRCDGELHIGPIADYFYSRTDLWFKHHFNPTSNRPCDPTSSRHFWRCSRRLRHPPPPARPGKTSPTLEQWGLFCQFTSIRPLEGETIQDQQVWPYLLGEDSVFAGL